jgi:serine phosphatase RsbU (regulator of sigma subunit)
VGDVVGHGATAAGDMMQLSGMLATLLGVGTPLDRLFTLVHEAVGPLGIMATAVVCEVDPVSGLLRYVSAGHPPLLLVRPDATMAMLNDGRRPLVGVGGTDVAVGEVAWQEQSMLMAYTDGLVERRGEHFDVGLDRLRDAVASTMGLDLESQLDTVVKRCTQNHLVEDDIAVVAVRAVPV